MAVNEYASANLKLVGSAKASASVAATVNFDFGTPDDLYLPTLANYKHGDRLLVVFTATTSGTTDNVLFSIQDAPDSAGSIGSVATALTDGTLQGSTGDNHRHTFVKVQSDRPWLRCRVISQGTTDVFTATVKVFAVGAVV